MPSGRIAKKSRKSSTSKRVKPSRRQLDEDLGKLQTLDRTIQEHQKAKFYGIADAQLDSQSQEAIRKASKHDRSIEALANLTKVDNTSKHSRQAKNARDMQALDSVLETLNKMDFASSQKEPSERHKASIADDLEIDI